MILPHLHKRLPLTHLNRQLLRIVQSRLAHNRLILNRPILNRPILNRPILNRLILNRSVLKLLHRCRRVRRLPTPSQQLCPTTPVLMVLPRRLLASPTLTCQPSSTQDRVMGLPQVPHTRRVSLPVWLLGSLPLSSSVLELRLWHQASL